MSDYAALAGKLQQELAGLAAVSNVAVTVQSGKLVVNAYIEPEGDDAVRRIAKAFGAKHGVHVVLPDYLVR